MEFDYERAVNSENRGLCQQLSGGDFMANHDELLKRAR